MAKIAEFHLDVESARKMFERYPHIRKAQGEPGKMAPTQSKAEKTSAFLSLQEISAYPKAVHPSKREAPPDTAPVRDGGGEVTDVAGDGIPMKAAVASVNDLIERARAAGSGLISQAQTAGSSLMDRANQFAGQDVPEAVGRAGAHAVKGFGAEAARMATPHVQSIVREAVRRDPMMAWALKGHPVIGPALRHLGIEASQEEPAASKESQAAYIKAAVKCAFAPAPSPIPRGALTFAPAKEKKSPYAMNDGTDDNKGSLEDHPVFGPALAKHPVLRKLLSSPALH